VRGTLAANSSDQAVAASPNGKIYLFGSPLGAPTYGVPTTQVFDPATGASSRALPARSTLNNSVSAVAVPDGRIFVFGGLDPTSGSYGVVEVFDSLTETWLSSATPMPTPRQYASAAYVNGSIYVAGGRILVAGYYQTVATLEIYNVAQNTWSTGPSLNLPRERFGLAASNGKLFAIQDRNPGSPAYNTVEILDTANPTAWSAGPPNILGRWYSNAVALDPGGPVFVVGGVAGPAESADHPIEMYWAP
jgi:N-acetylneuraminic acid mutarotase